MYFVYILESDKDHKLYVGYSRDWNERLQEHNQGKVISTKDRRPLKIIHLEGFLHQQDATKMEKFYKTGWGRTHLKKILDSYYKERIRSSVG